MTAPDLPSAPPEPASPATAVDGSSLADPAVIRRQSRTVVFVMCVVLGSVSSVTWGGYELSADSQFVQEHWPALLAFLGGLYVVAVVAGWAAWSPKFNANATSAAGAGKARAALTGPRFKKWLALVLLPAVASVVLGLLSFSFQEHKAREALLMQRMNTAVHVTEILAKFRATLVQFGSLCSPTALAHIPREVSGGAAGDGRPDCLELIQDLEVLWTDTSWRFAMRIEDVLSSNTCSEAEKPRSDCDDSCDMPDDCYVVKACRQLKTASVDAVSLEYRRLIRALVSYRNGQLPRPDSIGRLVKNLSERSRDLGCALQIAGYPPRKGGIPSSYCRASLRDHNWCEEATAWRRKVEMKGKHEPAEVDRLEWEAWWQVTEYTDAQTVNPPAAAPPAGSSEAGDAG